LLLVQNCLASSEMVAAAEFDLDGWSERFLLAWMHIVAQNAAVLVLKL